MKLSREYTTKGSVFGIANLYLGNPIAHLYVDRYFFASDKAKAEEIVGISGVMRGGCRISWMSQGEDIALLKMDYLKSRQDAGGGDIGT